MITKHQQDLLTGKLLGDGSLEDRGTANSRFQVRHSIKQKDYVDWCYQEIKEFTKSSPRRINDSYYFRTRSLPMFTRLRKKWYIEGRKTLPSDIKLSPFALAIWYMDDGYYDTHRDSIWFCTHCFNSGELKRIKELMKQLGIETTLIKDRTKYKTRVLKKHTERFIKLVKPYIVPSLLYKIGIAP